MAAVLCASCRPRCWYATKTSCRFFMAVVARWCRSFTCSVRSVEPRSFLHFDTTAAERSCAFHFRAVVAYTLRDGNAPARDTASRCCACGSRVRRLPTEFCWCLSSAVCILLSGIALASFTRCDVSSKALRPAVRSRFRTGLCVVTRSRCFGSARAKRFGHVLLAVVGAAPWCHTRSCSRFHTCSPCLVGASFTTVCLELKPALPVSI